MTGRMTGRTPSPGEPDAANIAGCRFDARRAEPGSPGRHATTVRTGLEMRGDLVRLPGAPVRRALPDPA